MSESELESCTVVMLKELLKSHGECVTGNKKSLIDRLMRHHAQLGIMFGCDLCSTTSQRDQMSKTKKTYERQSERTGWETLPPSTDIFTDSPVEVHGAINFKRAGPVIKRLPKGSRVQGAKAVTTLLEDV